MTTWPSAAPSSRKRSKYRSVHCWWCQNCNMAVDGSSKLKAICNGCGHKPSAFSKDIIHFDSKRERTRWRELCLQETQGVISDIERQFAFPIKINGIKIGTYRCDFQYLDQDGCEIIEDVKGMMTPLSKFKIKCVEAQYNISIIIVS